MKTLLVFLPLTALAAHVGVGAGSSGANLSGSCPRGVCPLTTLSVSQPTTLSAADLTLAVDEERMTHDLYAAAAARWNLPVFSNIAAAESRHAGAFEQLAASANLTLPAAQTSVYPSAEIQRLHDQLLPLMSGSEVGALRAAALLEETSIADLRQLLRRATDEPTKNVLTQLERSSLQHFSAFVRNLQSRGEVYQPQVLSAAEYSDAVAMRPMPGRGRGYRGGRS